MTGLLKRFSRQDKGAAFVETAFVLPVLILIIGGIFETGMYLLLNSKLTRMAGVVCDAVTRQDLSRASLIGLMDSADTVTRPFDFNKYGQMVVSQVRNTSTNSDPTKMLISWQQSKNGGVSRIGLPGQRPTNLPGDVTVINDQSMVITEVTYAYSPLIFQGYLPITTLYKVAVYVPRQGDMDTLLAD